MKDIKPISIWSNGQQIEATKMELRSIYDDLATYAQFYWQLFNSQDQPVTEGNLTMTDTAYTDWDQAQDINQYAWNWAAEQLNIQLL